MRAETEQPHPTDGNYKLSEQDRCQDHLLQKKAAFLPASSMEICGIFPPRHTKEAQGKDGTSPKELSGFPGRTPRTMEIVHLSVKVTGINKSGNVLVHHFWKLWMHDQGEQNYDTVTAALHPCMRVFLPGSTSPLKKLLLAWIILWHALLNVREEWTLKARSSLSSQRCLFPGSLCTDATFSLRVSV